MCQPDDNHPALPGREDPEGLWATVLVRAEREALRAAFDADRDLRHELEALMRSLEQRLRTVFVRELARALIGPPAPAAPVAAVLVALGATATHPGERPPR